MKILSILTLFTLFQVAKSWVAILQPIVLSLGAVFAALNIDSDLAPDIQLPFKVFKFITDKDAGTIDEEINDEAEKEIVNE